jgi:hypothetical protein
VVFDERIDEVVVVKSDGSSFNGAEVGLAT